MKKIVLFVFGLLLAGSTLTTAAAQLPTKGKIVNTRIVQASKDTLINYYGVRVFVPKGQTVIMGLAEDGSVVVRGNNLQGVQVGQGTLSSNGMVVFNVQPKSQVITVHRGTVVVQDAQGRSASVSSGAAVSAVNIRTPVTPNLANVQAVEAALPSFVAETEVTSAAAEQAVQDVEETKQAEEEVLSPSAP